jgi:UDP-N-acetyl-D-galactosamine dehydrogenase
MPEGTRINQDYDTPQEKGNQTRMSIYQALLQGDAILSVIGLGYVGMPIAVAFGKKVKVIGYDVNPTKIQQYRSGIDPTREVGDEAIRETTVDFTADPTRLQVARFHIIAVPTPINADKTPDLTPVVNASHTVGRNLMSGSFVVYESTVYPGVTEDICIPILEAESGLRCGEDFWVGYSPERINPGDPVNRLESIVKIVSAVDEPSLQEIAQVYELVITAGVHRARSIKVAEAAKVVENSQRDINIAFMNELAMVFDRMGIDTKDVIDAMNTKWNALKFYPGLVGGHCIGVDPYYFIYEAAKLGYHSQIILSGRKINDGMGEFVADALIKRLIQTDKVVSKSRVVIMGITFKENCPDLRNSRVVDIIRRLKEFGITPLVVDPEADSAEAMHEYGVALTPIADVKDADCLVFAVAHQGFRNLSWDQIDDMFAPQPQAGKVIIDVKSILDRKELDARGYTYWRL